jgi:hypothetical protein
MRFAYADPPYLGCGALYARHHPEALSWNDPKTHLELIQRLCDEYPDGWAMSASSPSLDVLRPMLPPGYRVCSWVKPFAVFKVNVGVAYAWEPVILMGGRRRTREQRTVRDWFSCEITLRKGLVGAKPPPVVHWILDLLNVQRGDEVDDLFPGTGVVGRCVAARVQGRPTLDDLPLGWAVAEAVL